MRVAVYYDSSLGRNDGNPLYVWNNLKERKDLEVDHLAPVSKENIALFGKYDLNVWVDWGEDGLTQMLSYVPVYPPAHPLIYWASDTHVGYDYRLKCSREADIVFVAQKRAVEEFKKEGVTAEWLPHAFEPKAYPKLNLISKKYDICFVGHINTEGRIDCLDRAFKEFPNFYYGQRLFEEAAQKYCESKIVINYAWADDLNMRVFETLGTGSFLLTNDIPTIHDLELFKKNLISISAVSVNAFSSL